MVLSYILYFVQLSILCFEPSGKIFPSQQMLMVSVSVYYVRSHMTCTICKESLNILLCWWCLLNVSTTTTIAHYTVHSAQLIHLQFIRNIIIDEAVLVQLPYAVAIYFHQWMNKRLSFNYKSLNVRDWAPHKGIE